MDRTGSRSLDGRLGDGSALARWGVRAWLVLGVLLATFAVLYVVAQFSGIVVPLVLAAVLGALFAPVVERLRARGLPQSAGAILVLVGLVAVVLASLWLVVAGVVDQGPEIARQVSAGVSSLESWLSGQGLEVPGGVDADSDGLVELARSGLPGLVTGLFSGVASFVFGAFIALFLLYYVLVDWPNLRAWVGGHLGLAPGLGEQVVADTVTSVRRYYWTLTLSAVVTAVLIGGAAWALGVPLALTIGVITLTTSYVPYLGAIVSGAFATLIALGSQGPRTAIVLLVVVLVVQNVIQTIVLTRLSSTALRMHPIVTLASTIVGAALAGVLGATLATPATAAAILVHRRLSTPVRTPRDPA